MKNYSYAMSVLYQTIRIVLMNCTNYLTDFAAFKSKYTPDYITGLRTELDTSEKMKADQARTLEHEQLRIEMLPLAELCRNKFKLLKRYIAESVGFNPALEVSHWDAAGWQYYEESYSSWDKLREMCSMATTYIEKYEPELMNEGYMPADFKDVFAEQIAAFNEKYDAFLVAQETAMQGTADKIEANNAIYAKIVTLCLDGQAMFTNDEVKKSLFSFNAVSELVKPTGAAGLKGIITQNGTPQAGLIVVLENGNKIVITDVGGEFDFGNRLTSGKDTMIIRRGDEILSAEEVVINPGVTKRENVDLAPAPVALPVNTGPAS